MGKLVVAVLSLAVAMLGLAAGASAFEGGGRKPSEAPLVIYGQHYTGQLNNHKSDANYNGRSEVALWRLPPVSTHDLVTVNWHVLPVTHGSGFPVCMALVQGVDDFSWGGVFGNFGYYSCGESGPVYGVSGSGSARTSITVQNTDAGSTYLEFFSDAETETPSSLETYPYDFSVEAPRHFLGLAIAFKKRVHANGAIGAAVTLANGLPAPDGLVFGLTVTWEHNGIASYVASTSGGRLAFPLALPESAVHERPTFVVSHGTDAEYQAVSARLRAQVTPAQATAAEVACAKATQHAHVLARQHRRLEKNAARARGAARRRLRRRARHVGRELRGARAQAGVACSA
jgi:hypothetical protein